MFDEKSYSLKMDKTIEVFSKELSSLRTGRANASMLDLVKVDVYGQLMPINQIGSITTPEPRMINIQVWDSNNVPLIDAAIQKSDLLIINKADLAPYVGVDLQAMEKDVKNARRELPYVFGEMKNFKGIDNISDFLFLEGGL